jgi:hypothetical protein
MRGLVLGLSLCVLVAGCSKSEEGVDIKYGAYSLFDPVAANPSLCGSPAIPFPNNALFSGFADPTLNVPNPAFTSFVIAANLTDGFSTTSSIFTDVLGQVDYASAANAVVIFEADATPRFLTYGVDFTVQPSPVMAQFSGTGHSAGTCTGVQPALFLPISQQRSRLLIEPLKPLNPSTTYIVAVTNDLLSTDGVPATVGDFFRVTNSSNKICDLTATDPNVIDCGTPGAPEDAAARFDAPFLSTLLLAAPPTTPAQKLGTLETLRSALVRPTVLGLQAANPALTDDRLIIAWSFTTQSTTKTLDNINTTPFAVPRTLGVVTTGTNTNQANPALANTANIYAGTVSLPYFLQTPADGLLDPDGPGPAGATTPAILATFFAADVAAPDLAASFPVGPVPCGAFASGAMLPGGITAVPSASTTICYPRPLLRTNQTVPLMVTVPNSAAPGNCGGRGTIAGSHATTETCVAPATGWPVVIFQHGITRNRSDMLAIAPTLASAGFVVVAIDLPLHGLVPASGTPGNPDHNGFCGALANNGFFAGAAERTFAADYVSNTTGAPGADGLVDCSGTHMVNLASLITSRDNLRQAESDILHLAKSVNGLDFDGSGATDEIAETNLRFLGQSLGAIVGTTVMGVDVGASATLDEADELFGAASLNVPGGGLGKLLDASASFGPRIAAGLGALGVFEGTDTYETFVRFAQHLNDPADPINFAVRANANHAIHLTEVLGDAVVPNAADSTCPAAADLPFGIGATATGFANAAETAAASGAAGAALLALCPPLALPPDPPLAAITYQDEVSITGFLSGTEPLFAIMGITNISEMGNVPFAAQANETGDTVVRFLPDTAEHGTLLTPGATSVADPDATFAAATCAMQKQAATFLASNGALLPIGGTCP